MELNRFFDLMEEIPDKAAIEAAFGPPTQVGEKTIIPVGRVAYGFGLGFGQGTAPSTPSTEDVEAAEGGEDGGASGSGGGGGGGLTVQPVAVLEVTPEATILRAVVDEGQVARTGMFVGAWIVFWVAKTLIKIFGKK